MTPFKYLGIRSSKGSRIADKRVALSVVLAILFVAILFYFSDLNIFGDSGLISRVGAFVSTLTGFYVAALVAVATFSPGKPEMDGKMVSGKLYFGNDDEEITRREYLTSLFGYLVTLAFSISLVSILIAVTSGTIEVPSGEFNIRNISISHHTFISFIASTIYFSALFHLVGETSLGLNYLIDKLYRLKPSVIPGSIKLVQSAEPNKRNPEDD